MTLGLAERQGDLLDDVIRFCDKSLADSSVYGFLHRERDALFPDEFFADLFSDRGRRSVPPSVVAVVMVLQRLEGLSDREAVERYAYDARWRYAAGVGGYDRGWASFAHTVLVDMRARLRISEHPDRIFEVTLDAARMAGLVGLRRVLDSTPLYDAVATMDTITLIRSALRGLLAVADAPLEDELRSVLRSGDGYADSAKPQIDWDDRTAQEALIDSRAKDAYACLALLDGRVLGPECSQAAQLLATVVGQDLEEGDDGVFHIARRVAKDRIISTVDPEARHGHKTASRGFDGYKGHTAVDPDSEIITATTVTPGNAGDASAAEELIEDLIDEVTSKDKDSRDATLAEDEVVDHGALDDDVDDGVAGDELAGHARVGVEPRRSAGAAAKGRGRKGAKNPAAARTRRAEAREANRRARLERRSAQPANRVPSSERPSVYGDAAYGTGEFQAHLEDHDISSGCKTQPPSAASGLFTKDHFAIDLDQETVRCPNEVTVRIRRGAGAAGVAYFGAACGPCPLRQRCTTATGGRTIRVGVHEDVLARARAHQRNPTWTADYRATRPKVERKLGHLMRRRHGGRRARVRGRLKVDADFRLLAAATNLARLATLGLCSTPRGWEATAG